PVELDGGAVPLEAVEVGQELAGHGVGGEEVPVESGGHDIRDHGPSHPHRPAAPEVDTDGAATPHGDGADGAVRPELGASCLGPTAKRLGEHPRTAFWDGEADVLTEHAQEPPEEAAAGTVRR